MSTATAPPELWATSNASGSSDPPRGWDYDPARDELPPLPNTRPPSGVVRSFSRLVARAEPRSATIRGVRLEKGDRSLAALWSRESIGDDYVTTFDVAQESALGGHAALCSRLAVAVRDAATDPDRLAQIVFEIEETQITDGGARGEIKSLLLRAVRFFCRTGEERWERCVWSGIRTYGSMIERHEIDRLNEFLDLHGAIDPRQVTLQMITNVFAAGPPDDSPGMRDIRNRVFDLARAAVNPARVAPGNAASLALSAVVALASLGDPRLNPCVAVVAASKKTWLIRLAKKLLTQVLSGWPADSEAARSIARVLPALDN